MFRQMELPGPKIKKIFIFQKTEPFSPKTEKKSEGNFASSKSKGIY